MKLGNDGDTLYDKEDLEATWRMLFILVVVIGIIFVLDVGAWVTRVVRNTYATAKSSRLVCRIVSHVLRIICVTLFIAYLTGLACLVWYDFHLWVTLKIRNTNDTYRSIVTRVLLNGQDTVTIRIRNTPATVTQGIP